MTKARDLADGVINTAELADGAITDVKLATGISASKLSGALPAISGAALTGISAGLSGADMWRQNANTTVNGTLDPMTANWERADHSGFGHIGTGMSQSSGIFTFPSTGYWEIRANFQFSSDSTDNQKTGYIVTTTDNSSYADAAVCTANFYASGTIASVNTNFIFDCTDTSTHKVRFRVASTGGSGNTLGSDTSLNMTFFTFIRLANT